MGQVEVTINGRGYQISCDDGEEEHLLQLSEYVNRKVEELVSTVGQVGDARLLVMTCLLIADELADTYAALEDAEADRGEPDAVRQRSGATEERAAAAIEALANRIEGIAARLETP
jgi:cell division protein ZapA